VHPHFPDFSIDLPLKERGGGGDPLQQTESGSWFLRPVFIEAHKIQLFLFNQLDSTMENNTVGAADTADLVVGRHELT
jgi:hypothetical protein